jgi:hypothetical protein
MDIRHSCPIFGQCATSVKLEPVFGRALTLVGQREGLTEHEVIVLVENKLRPGMSLTAAVRGMPTG